MKIQTALEKSINAANRLPDYWLTLDGNYYRFELGDSVLELDVNARIATYHWGDHSIPKTKRTSHHAVLLANKFGVEMRRKMKATAECPTIENWKNFS